MGTQQRQLTQRKQKRVQADSLANIGNANRLGCCARWQPCLSRGPQLVTREFAAPIDVMVDTDRWQGDAHELARETGQPIGEPQQPMVWTSGGVLAVVYAFLRAKACIAAAVVASAG